MNKDKQLKKADIGEKSEEKRVVFLREVHGIIGQKYCWMI